MGLLDYFRHKPRTADIAKQRLELLIAHQRSGDSGAPSYLPALQSEVLAVIRKYVDIDDEQCEIRFDRQGDCDILELNVSLENSDSVA